MINKDKITNKNDKKIERPEAVKMIYFDKRNNFVCEALQYYIYYANADIFVAFDGSNYYLYSYNIQKKYSNEQNCLQIHKTNKKIIEYDKISLGHMINGTIYVNKTYNRIIYDDLKYDKVEDGKIVKNDESKYIMHESFISMVKEKCNQKYIIEKIELIGGHDDNILYVVDNTIQNYKCYEPEKSIFSDYLNCVKENEEYPYSPPCNVDSFE